MSEEAGHGDADNAGASEPARWSFQDELNKGTHRPGKLCFRPNLYYGSYHATPHSTPLPSPGPSTPTHTVGKGWLDHVTQQAARSSTLPGSPLAHHAKALEDHFDMEENREGFFDMTVFETPGGNDKTNNLPHHVTFSDEPRTSTSPTLNEDVQIAIDEGIPPWEPSPSPPQSPSSSPSPTRRILQFAPILRQILDYFKPTLHPRVQHRIHKAVFATLIASLFTLIPPVQQWVGPYAAMSAVSLVYNHPARTVGAQVEAAFVGLFGILVGMTISLAGVGASVAYNAKYLQYGDHAGRVILVVFLLTGSFFVTYVWAKYPRFNLSGIMATFIMVFSLTTNVDNTTFSGKYVFDVVCPLSIGNIVALFINILIWRESASQGLGRAVDESLSEIRNLLNLTTSAFLLDPDRLDLPNSVVEEASSNMRKAMAKVLIADREARYEISYGYVRPSDFKDITKTIGRLAQHLSSLALSLRNEKFLLEARHGSVQMSKGYLELLTKLQDAGIEDHSTCTTCLKHHVSRPEGAWPRPLSRTHSELHLHTHKEDSESECDGDSPADHDKLGRPLSRSLFDLNQDTVTSIGSLAEHPSRPKMSPRRSDLSLDSPRRRPLPRKEIAFGDKRLLVKYLQGVKDPLAELTISCENTLDAMRLELAKELDIGVSHISLNENDAEASKSNPASRGKQWLRLLSLMTRKVPPVGEAAPAPAPDHSAQITAAIESFDSHEKQHLESMQYNATFRYFDLGHREELFLVFNFMFSLREVARELRNLADGVMTLKTAEPGCGGKRRKRIYLPRIDVSEWLRSSNHFMEKDRGGNLPAIFDQDDDEDDEILPSDSTTLGVSEQDGVESDNYEARPASSLEFLRVRRCLWYYTHGIGSYETKFAVKMALAITVISSLAFFDTTMEQFNEVRWQWASMSVFLVMNPAVGGTIWEGFLRVGGTVFGGLAGMATCAIIGPKSYVLTCLEVVMGYIFWYIFIATRYAKIGSIGMITFVVVTLTIYANPDQLDNVVSLGWKRTLAIVVGVLTALILNWCVWPFVARHQLRKHLSRVIYDLGALYSEIVGNYLGFEELSNAADGTRRLDAHEKRLRAGLQKCHELLALTHNEPRLKAPFPEKSWMEIVESTQNLMNRMTSLRCTAAYISPEVIEELRLEPIQMYRRDVTAAMLVYFHVLGGSLLSKVPLPPYFPSARIARIRMINRIRQFSSEMPLTGKAGLEYGNLSWYAYMSCTEEVIEELENLATFVKAVTGDGKSQKRRYGVRKTKVR